MDDISDKEKEYVTHDDLKHMSNGIHQKLDGFNKENRENLEKVDKFHKENHESLKTMFSLLSGIFNTMNDNIGEMVREQREINKNINHMNKKSDDYEDRLSAAEEKIGHFKPPNKVNVEKLKVVGYVIFLLVSLILGIYGVESLPKFPF